MEHLIQQRDDAQRAAREAQRPSTPSTAQQVKHVAISDLILLRGHPACYTLSIAVRTTHNEIDTTAEPIFHGHAF